MHNKIGKGPTLNELESLASGFYWFGWTHPLTGEPIRKVLEVVNISYPNETWGGNTYVSGVYSVVADELSPIAGIYWGFKDLKIELVKAPDFDAP